MFPPDVKIESPNIRIPSAVGCGVALDAETDIPSVPQPELKIAVIAKIGIQRVAFVKSDTIAWSPLS